MKNATTEALSSIAVIVNTESGPDGQPWTWKSQIDAIRSVLSLVPESPNNGARRIAVGDWVEVVSVDCSLPVGNRYQVKTDYGKALALEGLDKPQHVLHFKKIAGPDVPR